MVLRLTGAGCNPGFGSPKAFLDRLATYRGAWGWVKAFRLFSARRASLLFSARGRKELMRPPCASLFSAAAAPPVAPSARDRALALLRANVTGRPVRAENRR